jgi:hypothetical protein
MKTTVMFGQISEYEYKMSLRRENEETLLAVLEEAKADVLGKAKAGITMLCAEHNGSIGRAGTFITRILS